jgi:hypothetical protein
MQPLCPGIGMMVVGRNHPQDRGGLVVHGNGPAHDVRISSVAPLPEVMAEEGHVILTRLSVPWGEEGSH